MWLLLKKIKTAHIKLYLLHGIHLYCFLLLIIHKSYYIIYLIIHLLNYFSNLTIPCNKEDTLPRMPSTKDIEYNLSLSGTPSKRYVLFKSNYRWLFKKICIILVNYFIDNWKRELEETQIPNILNKKWRLAKIGDLTPEHFSTPRRVLRNLQLIQQKTKEQTHIK